VCRGCVGQIRVHLEHAGHLDRYLGPADQRLREVGLLLAAVELGRRPRSICGHVESDLEREFLARADYATVTHGRLVAALVARLAVAGVGHSI
jgi:hypothetical protein